MPPMWYLMNEGKRRPVMEQVAGMPVEDLDRALLAWVETEIYSAGSRAVPFSSLKLHPSLLKGIKELGLHPSHPDPGRRHPAGAGRPRRARLRHDRQRQDGGVSAADPAPADRQAPRHHAGARCSRRPASWRRRSWRTSTTSRCTRRSRAAAVFGGVGMGPQEHAFRSGVDVHHRHARPAARSLPAALRQARRARVPGARRGGPDARHGLPARHPPGAAPPAGPAPDALLQRHDAARRS